MSYKKDEDDAGILKVDRTSVFQEGQHCLTNSTTSSMLDSKMDCSHS